MNIKKKTTVNYVCTGAIIAALYALLTICTWTFSSMEIQLRVAEALCILPLFTSAAIPGLYIGCMISNLIAGNVVDAVFGAMATFAAALVTRLIGRKLKGKLRVILAPLPAVIFNALLVPPVLYYGYGVVSFCGFETVLPVMAMLSLSVLIGQTLACYGLGLPLYWALKKIDQKVHIFKYVRSGENP